jgi:hypothetical protein
LRHPVKPLETHALHPRRRSCTFAGEKVDGGADAKRHSRSDLGSMRVHPKLLLRRTESYEKQLRRGVSNPFERPPRFFEITFESERWSVRTDDSHAGVPCIDDRRGALGNPGSGTEQEDT